MDEQLYVEIEIDGPVVISENEVWSFHVSGVIAADTSSHPDCPGWVLDEQYTRLDLGSLWYQGRHRSRVVSLVMTEVFLLPSTILDYRTDMNNQALFWIIRTGMNNHCHDDGSGLFFHRQLFIFLC